MRYSNISNRTGSAKRITFDVMLRDRFVCTLRMPISLDMVVDYDGDTPIIDMFCLKRFTEQKRPSLKGKPYNICF